MRVCAGGRDQADRSVCRWRWGPLWGSIVGVTEGYGHGHVRDTMGTGCWEEEHSGPWGSRRDPPPHCHMRWMSTNGAENYLKTHIDRQTNSYREYVLVNIHLIYMPELYAVV